MKTEDNKVVIVDIGCVSALFLQCFVSFGTYWTVNHNSGAKEQLL